jgi:hypothetical protein
MFHKRIIWRAVLPDIDEEASACNPHDCPCVVNPASDRFAAAVAIELLQQAAKVAMSIDVPPVNRLKRAELMTFHNDRRALLVGQIILVANVFAGLKKDLPRQRILRTARRDFLPTVRRPADCGGFRQGYGMRIDHKPLHAMDGIPYKVMVERLE